jgi:hypothetical protein
MEILEILLDTLLALTLLVVFAIVPLLAVLIAAASAGRHTGEADAAARSGVPVITDPRFFARPGSTKPKERVGRAVVVQIEDYLERERAAVDHFVTSPSVETLCRGSKAFEMRKAAVK